jgi:proline dehydrogenase
MQRITLVGRTGFRAPFQTRFFTASVTRLDGNNNPFNPAIDFNNTQSAFKAKSTKELLLAYAVFRTCVIPGVVKHSETMIKFATKIFGKTFVMGIVKRTFFRHFCAGEFEKDIGPRVAQLNIQGVRGIMDYAAEADLAEAPPEKKPLERNIHAKPTIVSRTYDYTGELNCDANVEIFKSCIRTVSKVSPDGFAAIKITALGNPALLLRMNAQLVWAKKLFDKYSVMKGGVSVLLREEFHKVYDEIFHSATPEKIDAIFRRIDTNNSGEVDFCEWSEAMTFGTNSPWGSVRFKYEGEVGKAMLTSEELKLVVRMNQRAEEIASLAAEHKVRLMIDAEQTYFQIAIDNIVFNLQRKFNKDFPTIFTTYQCYLLGSMNLVKLHLQLAERGKYQFACKIVRGAYMHSERARATEMKYDSPIMPTMHDTHNNYNSILELCLRKIAGGAKINLMVASHNQASMEKAVRLMEEFRIHHKTGGVYFGQLLGMADHLTFSLGGAGFNAYKYLPYGPVHEVVPYLLRRVQENSDIMGGCGAELQKLRTELKRRLFGRQ